ncbi:hypothetical protein BDZ91DRAFT_787375 [Kalaharituber pfeilii]|nr:hypothetical protein BDZ91DRAFT_787375 [Kalaharituber pfeilii]
MDTTGFSREHYYLGKLFTMPDSSGGKRAIAISASHELMVVSAYTILVGGAFMAWWIIIAVSIPMVTPKKVRECEVVKPVATGAITEPLRAAFIMAKICYHIVAKKFSKPKTASTTYTGSEDSISMGDRQEWSQLLIAFVIMLSALVIVIASVVSGIYLPRKLVIGHVAPVNEMMVFIPPFKGPSNVSHDYLRIYAVVTSKSVGWAASSLDSSGTSMEARLAEHVDVKKIEGPRGPGGEEGYNVSYSFQVNSYDMGLQHLHDLSVNITGTCSFEYGWYEGLHVSGGHNQSDNIDMYTIFNTYTNIRVPVRVEQTEPRVFFDWSRWNKSFSGDTPKTSIAILPRTQGRPSPSSSRDPWYLTRPYPDLTYNEIQPGRPPLQCNEERAWNYRGSYLGPDIAFYTYDPISMTSTRIRRNGTHIPHIPLGIWTLLGSIPPFGTVGTAFAMHKPGKLESNTRAMVDLVNDTWSLDAGSASAYLDIRRMAYTAYLMWRNVFRNAALQYISMKQLGLEKVQNDVQDQGSGTLLPGTGDFVVPSDSVSTLRLEVVIGIPAVVVFSWVVVGVATFLERRRHTKPTSMANLEAAVVKSQPK